MRHNLLTIIAIASLTFGISHSFAAVGEGSEVACSNYGADALSCNQCFDGGTDYVGDTNAKAFDDTFINKSSLDLLLARNGGMSAGPVQLQSSIGIGQSNNYNVSFAPSIVWFTQGGEDVVLLPSATSTALARMTGGVLFTKVLPGADASRPAMRFEYNVRVQSYNFVTKKREGAVMDHKECAFVTARWCGDAIVSNGEVCDDGDQNGQPGKCNTLCNGTIQPAVSCDNMTATPLSGAAPLNVAVACTGTNASTYRIDCGNGITNLTNTAVCRYPVMGTYTPRCYVNGNVTSAACTKTITVTPPVVIPGFDLSLKKYIGTDDAQTTASGVVTTSGALLNYVIRVTNSGSSVVSTSGTTTVQDILPAGVEYSGATMGTGWTCTTTGRTLTCTSTQVVGTGTSYPDITVPVRVTQSGSTPVINIAAVDNPFEIATGRCNASGLLPTTDTGVCTLDASNSDPAVLLAGFNIIPGFDLSLKKYIGTNDAQTAVASSTNALFNYVIRVTNSGASRDSSSGVTTVQDILPAGVEYVGSGINTASGAGWTCNSSSRTLTCTSTGVVGSGASYPDITVPVRVSAVGTATVTNIAAVSNPNEVPTGRCMASGGLPTTDTGVCTLDASNSDPAVFGVGGGGGGGGGGASSVGFKCVGGVSSCALYNSLIACEAEVGKGNCDSADASGQARCANRVTQSPICIGGGSVSCGDGVLQPNLGEECDVVGGAVWCQSCKVTLKTNPGANPITDIWMTIPTFAGTNHLGYSWLDGMPGRIAFQDNRMVLGQGTKAFTLADTVGFGIKTQYTIPLIIPASKRICLKSEGSALNGASICTTFGEAGTNLSKWTRADGEQFVNMGQGYYQILNLDLKPDEPTPPANPVRKRSESDVDFQKRVNQYNAAFDAYMIDKKNYDDWRQYKPAYSNSSNEILLFKGAKKYSSENNNGLATLNSTFYGMSTGEATISLYTPDNGIILSVLPVRTSAAVVASIGASANRSLETFLNINTSPFASFIGQNKVNTSTTINNQVAKTTTVPLPVIVGGSAGTVTSVAELEQKYAVNGNKNILSVNGDLTIECPATRSIFEMNGVRTVIVNGNLIIKCNLVFASNDTISSWAWITKGGDIKVYNGNNSIPSVGAVTNLAGVFIALKEGNVGGDFRAIDDKPTQTILRVEGSMYGNATPLFNSRLYARATSAYDILTTGTVLTYSNRALVSPPPLLSQYLGNYSVQRVIQ